MKIVFAISTMGFGGAERVIATLSNHLAQHHQIIIAMLGEDGNCVYPLKEVRTACFGNNGGVVQNYLAFRKFCVAEKPDVVVAFLTGLGILCSTALSGTGIPVIASERNDPFQKDQRPQFPISLLEKRSWKAMAGYVFQSKGAQSYFPDYVQKKSTIILNPVDIESLPERDLSRKENVVISVGRLDTQKNQKLLIEAFAKSRCADTYQLHIYGEGPLREELQRHINALGMENRILLQGNAKNVKELVAKAEIFAFSSDYEGLPNALIEAMAIGLPCISTDCSPGGARALIDHEKNGILVPCGDAEAFTAALDMLCADAAKRKELGQKARQIRETVNINSIADQWIAFIKSCLPEGR